MRGVVWEIKEKKEERVNKIKMQIGQKIELGRMEYVRKKLVRIEQKKIRIGQNIIGQNIVGQKRTEKDQNWLEYVRIKQNW